VTIRHLWPFYSQNVPITYFIFLKKKTIKKLIAYVGVAEPPPSLPSIYIFLFIYLFIFCFGWGHFENKKAKGVELPQFESLRGLSVTLETLEVKVQIDGYFKEVKCNFPIIIIIIFFPNNNTNNIFSQSPSPVSLVIEIDKAVSTMKLDLIKNYCS
jgi:hypothetical protein